MIEAHELTKRYGDVIDRISFYAPYQADRSRWSKVMAAAYEELCEKGSAVLDDYGTEGPGEFFAVVMSSRFWGGECTNRCGDPPDTVVEVYASARAPCWGRAAGLSFTFSSAGEAVGLSRAPPAAPQPAPAPWAP